MVGSWEEFKSYCWKLLQYSQEICDLIVTIDQMPHTNSLDYSKEDLADAIYKVFRIKEGIVDLLQRKMEK